MTKSQRDAKEFVYSLTIIDAETGQQRSPSACPNYQVPQFRELISVLFVFRYDPGMYVSLGKAFWCFRVHLLAPTDLVWSFFVSAVEQSCGFRVG
jgi:hypothetical protein